LGCRRLASAFDAIYDVLVEKAEVTLTLQMKTKMKKWLQHREDLLQQAEHQVE
jgi:hypothetical protein